MALPKKKDQFTGPVADNDRSLKTEDPEFTGPVADNDRTMEMDDAELDGAVDQQEAEVASQQQAAVGQAAPMSPEGLSPERVNVLGETIIGTMEQLTGGQVTEMPETIDAPVEQMPPRLFTQLAAVQSILDMIPSAEGYRFDSEQAAMSDEGLAEAIAAIGQAGRDKNVRRELASMAPPEAEEAPAPEAPPEDEDLSGYM